MKPVYITYKNKQIKFLKTQEGDYKAKKWDNDKKQMVETNEIHHGKVQNFTINLGKNGRQDLGWCKVEYWGDKTLVEGKVIDIGCFYLRQKKGTTKDPRTFIEKKMSEVVLVMVDFHNLVDYEKSVPAKSKDRDEKLSLTPEQSIEQGLKEYNEDKEELVAVNDEFPPLKELE